MKINRYFLFVFIGAVACSEKPPIPKPETTLRLEIPKNDYSIFDEGCAFTYELNKLYKSDSSQVKPEQDLLCHQFIKLSPFNSSLQLWHYNLKDSNALEYYINTSIDMMEERHQVLATGMTDVQFIRKDDRVFGTLFELKGNVATPFQFYLTDSTNNFVRGEVLVEFRPNYDSMKPSLSYIRTDIEQLMKSFKWKR